MRTQDAAKRWADTWTRAWPAHDIDAIVALQAEDGDHYASMFRRYRGAAGLRDYVTECFEEETSAPEVWFASPRVDGDTAAIEYWAIMYLADGPTTVSGCTVARFDADGRVAEARDYSHMRPGREEPPAGLFTVE